MDANGTNERIRTKDREDGKERGGADGATVDRQAFSDRKALEAACREAIGDRPAGLCEPDVAARLAATAGISVASWRFVSKEEDLAQASAQVGYPLVLKVASSDISHKSDVGGVQVGIGDEAQLVAAYHTMMERLGETVPDAAIEGVTLHAQHRGVELALGANRDAQFGPVVMFGVGGLFVELYQDVVFRVAPFDESDALDALSEIKAQALLNGFRGLPTVDRKAVALAGVGLGRLMLSCPRIAEVDLNPVIVSGADVIAVDVRVVLSN